MGPFFGLGLPYPGGSRVVDERPSAGRPVTRHGLRRRRRSGVPDALVELWQPDGAGRIPRAAGSLRRDGGRVHRIWPGGDRRGRSLRVHHADTGLREQSQKRPHAGLTGAFASARQGNAPFFAITVFARGLLDRLFTRAYLPDGDLDADPLLASVDAGRRATLVCVAESASARTGYRFDIHLQGRDETVFLTYRDGRR